MTTNSDDQAPDIPKYSILEIERRMQLDPNSTPPLEVLESRLIEDRYFSCGRLRLRKVRDLETGATLFKLCKKYGETAPMEEPIVNIYLSEAEYNELLKLPGNDLVKTRYRYEYQGASFSIDAHCGSLSGLFLMEKECETVAQLNETRFPPFAVREVTRDLRFNGANLAKLYSNPEVSVDTDFFVVAQN